MKKVAVIVGIILLLAAIAAAIAPMWTSTAAMPLSGAGLAAVIMMIVGCFAVGGALMFLIFYSARHGHDDAAHYGGAESRPPGPNDNSRRPE